APRLQIGPKPLQGLAAEVGTLLAFELVSVLALAAAGQRGSAGGVITVAGLEVGGQPGVDSGGGGGQLGEGGGTVLKVTNLEEADPFALVGRLNLAREDIRKFRLQSEQRLALLQLPRKEGLPRIVSAQQFQSCLGAGFGLCEAPLPQQRLTKGPV